MACGIFLSINVKQVRKGCAGLSFYVLVNKVERKEHMPLDLPLGNGNLLVAFDDSYQIRDLYWPHVGQENHALGNRNNPFGFVGVTTDSGGNVC
jgi:hypothetical protein